jgi:hypothetical protein
MSVEEPDSDSSNKQEMDPLVRLMLDPKVIALSSTLMAKLEYIRYDETRRGVFRTTWGKDVFQLAVSRLSPDGKLKNFDIDVWFCDIVSKYAPDRRDKFDFKPSKLSQTVDTNWMFHLFDIEKDVSGFMLLLHNSLDLEDSTHSKMAEKSKKEDEYDFFGVGNRNKATQLLLGNSQTNVRRASITSGH